MNKKNYKDFKIGQNITCIKLNTNNYIGGDKDNERLIIGESYTITDVDPHFPYRVCIKLKGPYYFHQEFVPIECFDDIIEKRNLKINQILT